MNLFRGLLVVFVFSFSSLLKAEYRSANSVEAKYSKSKSLRFSRLHQISYDYKLVNRTTMDGAFTRDKASGISYKYLLNDTSAVSALLSFSETTYQSGGLTMNLKYTEILGTYEYAPLYNSKKLRAVGGLGVLNERVENTLDIGSLPSSASADEWRPIYAAGLKYEFYISDLLEDTQLIHWTYEVGLMYRGEFRKNSLSYMDIKVLGLGYRF